jgi:predicted NBD/HSP70 family sugar kinase
MSQHLRVGYLWGVDLGGTKIEGVVLAGADTTGTVCRLRIPTEAEQGYEHIVEQVVRMVGMLEEAAGQPAPAIGIGTPGAVAPSTGLMKNCNTTSLNGRPLPQDLKSALKRDAIVANDANCFALAEAQLGAARGAEVVFGVIMGTGVGGGIVVNGKVLNGKQGIAGEWGHNLLEENGEPCYCGKRGCVETVLAGPWLEKYYARNSGNTLRLPAILAAARKGDDVFATQTLERLVQKFGEGISVIVNILDPDVIVLGGGVGNVEELYTAGVASLERFVFNNELTTQIVKPMLGDSAGVFGAAHLMAGLG